MKKLLLLLLGFVGLQLQLSAQSLTAITPNSGTVGQNQITTTITGSNIFFTSISQWGNLENVELRNGSGSISVFNYMGGNWNAFVNTQDVADVTWDIPTNAVAGVYDVCVTTLDPGMPWVYYYDTLYSAFTINPPDGYVSGSLYYDANANGIRDGGETGLSNMVVQLTGPSNYTVYTNTNGDFSFGVANGSYTLTAGSPGRQYHFTSPSTIPVTVSNNNTSGLDIGAIDPLYAMSPRVGFRGQANINATVNAYDNIFTTSGNPWGNISYGYLTRVGGGASLYLTNTVFNVLSQNQVQLVFNIPSGQAMGDYRLYIVISGGQHYLDSVFTVVDAPSYLSGSIYFDANNNGAFDVGEPPISGQRVFASPDSAYSFSNNAGLFSIGAVLGTHDVSWQSTNGLFYLSSSPATYTFTNTGNQTGLDFGLRSTAADYTTAISFNPGIARCSWSVVNYVTITNRSNVVSQGTLQVIKSANQTYTGGFSPGTAVISGDTLTWAFSNLQPMGSQTFTYGVVQPFSGTVTTRVRVNVTDSGGTPMFSDATSMSQTVTCSYDPNDKAVIPAGVDSVEHYTLFSDTLDYKIRFQNTGTDTAFVVIIRDTIDAGLDLTTLELVASSHPVELSIDSNRAAVFTFNNILLPDSNVDEPGSNGFVRYRIKSLQGLPEKTRVENTAFIYFDLNAPVETNTVWNSMVSVIPTAIEVPVVPSDRAVFFPNPMHDRAFLLFRNEGAEQVMLKVIDIHGREVIQQMTTGDRFELQRGKLAAGVYSYVIIWSSSDRSYSGRIVMD